MLSPVLSFLRNDTGAVTVDWTVLSAAAVSLALATVAVIDGGIDGLISRIDSELRAQQLSDDFVVYTPEHFEPLMEIGLPTELAEMIYDVADTMMNQDIIDMLAAGVAEMENGNLSLEEIVALVGVASVAYQRNIIGDEVLEHYFGFNGNTAQYVSQLPTGTDIDWEAMFGPPPPAETM